jgi:hypothetical protein
MTFEAINAYEQERMVRIHAVNVLGDIRAIEATQILVEHITQVVPSVTNHIIFGDSAPCLNALIKIGKPGAKAAMKELRKPMKIPRRILLAVVIAKVEGRRAGGTSLQKRNRHCEWPWRTQKPGRGVRGISEVDPSPTITHGEAESLKHGFPGLTHR